MNKPGNIDNTNKEISNSPLNNKKGIIVNCILAIIIVVASCSFLYSAYRLISIYKEYKAGTDEYSDLQQYISHYPKVNNVIPQTKNKPYSNQLEINIDFKSLKDINSDIVGWLYFENCNINYPIVKGTNNDFYLKHTFKKEKNNAGSIFVDYTNNPDFNDSNTLIYGHNLKNNSMFGILTNFKEEAFYKENSHFWIITPSNIYKYEIFSCYFTDSTSESYNTKFASKEAFDKYLKNITNKSLYNTGITLTEDTSIVSLSTCATGNKSTRFIVHGKRLSSKLSAPEDWENSPIPWGTFYFLPNSSSKSFKYKKVI